MQGSPYPPFYASRLRSQNLRWWVCISAFIFALYLGAMARNVFLSMSIVNQDNTSKYNKFAIAIGAMYVVALSIQLFGMVSTMIDKLPFIRAYTYSHLLAVLLALVATIMRIVLHFKFKQLDMKDCTDSLIGAVAPDQSTAVCQAIFNRLTSSLIVELIFGLVLLPLFVYFVLAYLAQTLVAQKDWAGAAPPFPPPPPAGPLEPVPALGYLPAYAPPSFGYGYTEDAKEYPGYPPAAVTTTNAAAAAGPGDLLRPGDARVTGA